MMFKIALLSFLILLGQSVLIANDTYHKYPPDKIKTRSWLGGTYEIVRHPKIKSIWNFILNCRSKPIGVVLLNATEDSPIGKSELKRGDVITRINDEKITSIKNLYRAIWDTEINSELKLVYLRDGIENKTTLVTQSESYLREKYISISLKLFPDKLKLIPNPNYNWFISSFNKENSIPEKNDVIHQYQRQTKSFGNNWDFFLYPIGFGAKDVITKQGG